jgi:hypothetical protein
MWVERIAVVCNRRPPVFHPSSSLPTDFQSPNSSLYQQQHSIPEDGVLLNGVDFPSSLPSSTTTTTTTTNTNGNTVWSTLGPTDRLYKDLPESLAGRIRDKIETFLPMCQADFDRPPWKVILQTDTIAATTTDPDGTGRSIVQSRKTFRNLPALHVFSLLVDISRRHLYEGNVQADERIKVLNDHTFLDYYSYKAVSGCQLGFPLYFCSVAMLISLSQQRRRRRRHLLFYYHKLAGLADVVARICRVHPLADCAKGTTTEWQKRHSHGEL